MSIAMWLTKEWRQQVNILLSHYAPSIPHILPFKLPVEMST